MCEAMDGFAQAHRDVLVAFPGSTLPAGHARIVTRRFRAPRQPPTESPEMLLS